MKRTSIFVFIISFAFVQSVHAGTTISNTPTTTTTTPSSGAGTNQTAKNSGSSATIAMVASGIAGAAFLKLAIAAPPPKKPPLYILAAANLAAAALMSGGAKNAGAVDNATLGVSLPGGLPGYNPTADGGVSESSTAGFDAQLAALDQQVQDAGYSMSPDGSAVTLPSGQTVSTADIAAGKVPGIDMTDDLKAQAAAIEADAMKKASGAKVVAIGLQDGGGGGGGAGLAAADDNSSKFDMAAYLKKLKNRDPSSVSGLSKKLGEDNIGIKSDNIFDMVSRQYKRKQSQSAFIN